MADESDMEASEWATWVAVLLCVTVVVVAVVFVVASLFAGNMRGICGQYVGEMCNISQSHETSNVVRSDTHDGGVVNTREVHGGVVGQGDSVAHVPTHEVPTARRSMEAP